MKRSFPFLALLGLMGCYAPTAIQYTVTVPPRRPLVPEPDRIAVANGYDVKAQSYRENKEHQFIILIDEAMKMVSSEIENQTGTKVLAEQGLSVYPQKKDSCIQALMAGRSASHLIVINSVDVYFDQTDVEVTETESGKSREAFYNIVAKIGYGLWTQDGLAFDTIITASEFHSSRSVLSGFLAAGPNVVMNNDDALAIIHLNVQQYVRSFFPAIEPRERYLYASKEFAPVGEAIAKDDYDSAFVNSEALCHSPDPKIAAKAYYNCAVLSERLGQADRAKSYLDNSLKLRHDPFSQLMLYDYDPTSK